MTYLELMKTGEERQIAAMLCDLVNDVVEAIESTNHRYCFHACEGCPASEMCKAGHNGFHAWLQKEVE